MLSNTKSYAAAHSLHILFVNITNEISESFNPRRNLSALTGQRVTIIMEALDYIQLIQYKHKH